MKARLSVLATICVAAILSACGDPTSLRATLGNFDDTLTVFALSGTPPSYPSGVSIVARQAVRVDGFASFDFAVDIDDNGNVVLLPVNLVVSSIGGTHRVGLQKVPGAFADVLEAPKTGYDTTAAVVLAPGEVAVIEAAHNGGSDVCGFALSPFLYAKIGVDSLSLASRTIHLHTVFDPNCGFRSFADGIPTS
ncbi:MAG: hypothetical protein ABR585_04750 [Gemmatimonadaceae bacterium]